MTRPTFLETLLDSWQLTLRQGNKRDLIPYWIAGSALIGWAVTVNLPSTFWSTDSSGSLVPVASAALTFNGIILALCWSAFAKVYEIIGAGAFCAHLRKHNLLSHYLMFVGYCHSAQVVAILFSAASLLAAFLPLEPWVVKTIFGGAIATSFYAVRQGVATSQVMQDLIWQKSEFDAGTASPNVHAVAG